MIPSLLCSQTAKRQFAKKRLKSATTMESMKKISLIARAKRLGPAVKVNTRTARAAL